MFEVFYLSLALISVSLAVMALGSRLRSQIVSVYLATSVIFFLSVVFVRATQRIEIFYLTLMTAIAYNLYLYIILRKKVRDK